MISHYKSCYKRASERKASVYVSNKIYNASLDAKPSVKIPEGKSLSHCHG